MRARDCSKIKINITIFNTLFYILTASVLHKLQDELYKLTSDHLSQKIEVKHAKHFDQMVLILLADALYQYHMEKLHYLFIPNSLRIQAFNMVILSNVNEY